MWKTTGTFVNSWRIKIALEIYLKGDVNDGYLPEDLVLIALCAREYKTKKQGKIQRALPAFQWFSATPPLEAVKVRVSILMSVSLSNRGNIIED